MKLFCTLALVATASALVETRLDSSMLDSLSGDAKFGAYKTMFGKSYGSADDESAAKAAFFANDAIIATHNAKGLSYWLGHNEFSDLTWEQFKAQYVGRFEDNPHNARAKNYKALPAATDDSVDWVTKGAVTPVKNQARCGSCWAFSTTGSFEGAYQIAGNPLTSFSEQDLVSCAASSGNQGCNGGLMDDAFKWIQTNGLCTEADYPY